MIRAGGGGGCTLDIVYLSLLMMFSSFKIPCWLLFKKNQSSSGSDEIFPNFRKTLLSLAGQPGNCAGCWSGLGLAFQYCKQILQFIKTAGLHCLPTSFPLHLSFHPVTSKINKKKKSTNKNNWRCYSQFTAAASKVKTRIVFRSRIRSCCLSLNLGVLFIYIVQAWGQSGDCHSQRDTDR